MMSIACLSEPYVDQLRHRHRQSFKLTGQGETADSDFFRFGIHDEFFWVFPDFYRAPEIFRSRNFSVVDPFIHTRQQILSSDTLLLIIRGKV